MTGGEKQGREREELGTVTGVTDGGGEQLVEFVVEVRVTKVVFGHEDKETVEGKKRNDSTSIVRIGKKITKKEGLGDLGEHIAVDLVEDGFVDGSREREFEEVDKHMVDGLLAGF